MILILVAEQRVHFTYTSIAIYIYIFHGYSPLSPLCYASPSDPPAISP
jgi:hypothetical protein